MAGQRPLPPSPPSSRAGFKIAVICALPEERDTVEALMTKDYRNDGIDYGKANGDENSYTLGELGNKAVVLVAPRAMGTTNTRDLARQLRFSFPNILYALVVGICGGAPFVHKEKGWVESGIHLGDVIISTHVIEYDFGKQYDNEFARNTETENSLPRAPAEVANFVNKFVRRKGSAFKRLLGGTNADLDDFLDLETGSGQFHAHPGAGTDHVYDRELRHKHQTPGVCFTCDHCLDWYDDVCDTALRANCDELGCKPSRIQTNQETKIHFGRYASGNAVMKSAHRRDALIKEEGVIGFEMEGAGAWEVLATIVIKGVVDYADSHKSKQWRGYPAARAALCAKTLIQEIVLPDERSEHLSG